MMCIRHFCQIRHCHYTHIFSLFAGISSSGEILSHLPHLFKMGHHLTQLRPNKHGGKQICPILLRKHYGQAIHPTSPWLRIAGYNEFIQRSYILKTMKELKRQLKLTRTNVPLPTLWDLSHSMLKRGLQNVIKNDGGHAGYWNYVKWWK